MDRFAVSVGLGGGLGPGRGLCLAAGGDLVAYLAYSALVRLLSAFLRPRSSTAASTRSLCQLLCFACPEPNPPFFPFSSMPPLLPGAHRLPVEAGQVRGRGEALVLSVHVPSPSAGRRARAPAPPGPLKGGAGGVAHVWAAAG